MRDATRRLFDDRRVRGDAMGAVQQKRAGHRVAALEQRDEAPFVETAFGDAKRIRGRRRTDELQLVAVLVGPEERDRGIRFLNSAIHSNLTAELRGADICVRLPREGDRRRWPLRETS